MKKISFVIITWNSEKYVRNCIESILNIKKFNIEIFVVDNGSIDNTLEILNQIKNEKINITSLEKNYGTTISRNIGLHLIKNTDYICILDSDTVINEEAFLLMSRELENNQNIGIIGPSMINDKGEKQIPYRKFPTWKIKILKACPIKAISKIGEKMESYDLEKLNDLFECDYLISACWLMKYETYKNLGDLDEKIFYSPEDVEYCMRARVNDYKIMHLKSAQIIHLYQRISKKKLISKANITHLIGINYVLRKYKHFLEEYKRKAA